ncbi:MAG: hypothetical protein V4515_09630 [Chloroflexota bacterium]
MDYILQWALGLAIFLGIVFGLFWLIVRVTRAVVGPTRRLERDLGIEVLEARHRRGEITDEELVAGKRLLGSG